ncbi:hypothetical protein BVRB_028550, partial [Beta vulgaris subsp. vulgaris]
MCLSLFALYMQAEADAGAASKAYTDASIANPSDPRLPALREARDDAEANAYRAVAALQAGPGM